MGGAVFGCDPDGVKRLVADVAIQPLGYRLAERRQPVLLRLVALHQIADLFADIGMFATANLRLDRGILVLAERDGHAEGGHGEAPCGQSSP